VDTASDAAGLLRENQELICDQRNTALWRLTAVAIGTHLNESVETLDIHQRIRVFARTRLAEAEQWGTLKQGCEHFDKTKG
jgi:hypothetical protein